MQAKWTQAVLQQVEKSAGAITDTLARSEAVLGAAGRVLETSGILRMVVDRTLERAMSAWRMPTRSDVEDLLRAVAGVERKVDDAGDRVAEIEAKLDTMMGLLAAQAKLEVARSPQGRAKK
jgi:conjugal transfer/entry exclusion protein